MLFGRRFGAGLRSHTQQIAIGLSTASIAQLAVRLIWQQIAVHTTIHSQAEYAHVMGLQDKFYSANNVLYLVVLMWWIVCLWIDEPGSVAAGTAVATAEIPATADESTPQSDEAPSEPDANAESFGKTTEL